MVPHLSHLVHRGVVTPVGAAVGFCVAFPYQLASHMQAVIALLPIPLVVEPVAQPVHALLSVAADHEPTGHLQSATTSLPAVSVTRSLVHAVHPPVLSLALVVDPVVA